MRKCFGNCKCWTHDWWFLLQYSNPSADRSFCLPLLGPNPVTAHCSVIQSQHALADSLWLLLVSGSFCEANQTSGYKASWPWYFHVRLGTWDQNLELGEEEAEWGQELWKCLWEWYTPFHSGINLAYPSPLHSGCNLYVQNIPQFLKCTCVWLLQLLCKIGKIIHLIL